MDEDARATALVALERLLKLLHPLLPHVTEEIWTALPSRETRFVALLRKPLQLGITVSPDNRWVMYTQIDQRVEDLMLVEGFK